MPTEKTIIHYNVQGVWTAIHPETEVSQIVDLDTILQDIMFTDYVENYRGEGNATFVGRNKPSALTSDTTWKLRVIWHRNGQLETFDYDNVSWDDRYNYPE